MFKTGLIEGIDRIEMTLHNLDQFVEGKITDMLQALLASDLNEAGFN